MIRKLIGGKYDSHWKPDWNLKTNKATRTKYKGYFMPAMAYACWVKGGIKMIQHVRNQPWTTWRSQ